VRIANLSSHKSGTKLQLILTNLVQNGPTSDVLMLRCLKFCWHRNWSTKIWIKHF